jgi:hypothetical protein
MPQPFYQSSSQDESVRLPHRLLLLSYHFPPSALVGGMRWLQMSRYLAQKGWGLDVVAGDFNKVPARDEGTLRSLPPNVRIFSAAEPESSLAKVERTLLRMFRRMVPRKSAPSVNPSLDRTAAFTRVDSRSLIRASSSLIGVDRERLWANHAARIGIALARRQHYDAIVSSGPLHMAHEGARQIAKAVGRPLVIDFRDPWSGAERLVDDHASPVWYALARFYERRAVHAASLAVMNTDRSRDYMRALYPGAAQRIITVRNGSDDEAVPPAENGNRFTIRYAGSIYLDRDPRPFLRGASMAVQRLGLTPSQFGIEMIGSESFNGKSLEAIAEEERVAEFVQVGPRRPRLDTMRFLAGATMLVTLPQDSSMCVPAKLFEYVQFNAWLLVLAVEQSATADVLRNTNADVVEPHDIERIAAVIEGRYVQYARGEKPDAVGKDGTFDRVRQVEVLLDHLRAITSGPARVELSAAVNEAAVSAK